jgi:2-polyprenyl-3-methyl-5-hydroxy-6-metoxy-1,4-benzoquinol methylase
MPSFWWFRDSHYIAGNKLRIHATIIACGDCGPDNVTCYINGSEVTPVRKTSSAYADRSFWFLPEENRFGLTFEQPYLPATTFSVATVSPAGDAPEYRSGQFISWERIEPTPPIQNIERVSGKGATAYNYHNNGLTDFLRFSGIARANGIECRAPDVTVLDWGCGCGRLTRHLLENADDPANVHGIDIDPDNIKWCKHNLAEGSFDHVELYPPTELESQRFDLIIANSVLSHLKLDAMHSWLEEVARLLKPNGLALLSYHGDFSLGVMASRSAEFLKKTIDTGFNSSLGANELTNFISDPEYYRQTFMTDARARRIFNDYLNIEDVKLGIVSRYQNVAVLRK